MSQSQNVDYRRVIRLIRWITRIAGSLLFLLVTMIFIGSIFSESIYSVSPPVCLTTSDIIMFVGMFAMTAGVVVGWFREFIASILIIGGYLLFMLTHLIRSGDFLRGWVFITFAIVGIAYLLVWCLDRKYKKEDDDV